MATPRKLCKTAWNYEMAKAHRLQREIRQESEHILRLLRGDKPLSVPVVAVTMANILRASGDTSDALMVLQEIAEEAR